MLTTGQRPVLKNKKSGSKQSAILHIDNAPPHIKQVAMEALKHPLYARRFHTLEELTTAVTYWCDSSPATSHMPVLTGAIARNSLLQAASGMETSEELTNLQNAGEVAYEAEVVTSRNGVTLDVHLQHPGSLQQPPPPPQTEQPPLQVCALCGQRFTTAAELHAHRLDHGGSPGSASGGSSEEGGKKSHECVTCGARFGKRAQLSRHERAHSGRKPHRCDSCGKAFVYQCKLAYHRRIHLGSVEERRHFTCSLCGKGFTQKGALQRHDMIHMGLRPFACDTCGKDFTQKTHLQKHQKMHAGK